MGCHQQTGRGNDPGRTGNADADCVQQFGLADSVSVALIQEYGQLSWILARNRIRTQTSSLLAQAILPVYEELQMEENFSQSWSGKRWSLFAPKR